MRWIALAIVLVPVGILVGIILAALRAADKANDLAEKTTKIIEQNRKHAKGASDKT